MGYPSTNFSKQEGKFCKTEVNRNQLRQNFSAVCLWQQKQEKFLNKLSKIASEWKGENAGFPNYLRNRSLR